MSVVLLKPGAKRGGGLEKATKLIATAFQKRGKTVTLLTSGEVESPIEGITTESISPLSSFSLKNLVGFEWAAQKWLKKHPSPVVFGFDRHMFQTHLRAGNGVHAAFLDRRKKMEGFFKRLSFQLNPYHQLLLRVEQKGFEHPDLQRLFVNSDMVKREILHYYDVNPKKISLVPNGIDWEGLATPFQQGFHQASSLKKCFGLPESPLQILFIGHGFRRKGLKELLQALALLKKEDWHLSVVGRDREKGTYLHLTHQLGIEGRVTFFGVQKDATPFYQMADLVVVPSHYDPFANVTLEALGMGVPVVSSKENGGHEILKEPYGFTIPSMGDLSSFAETLKTAFSHGKKSYQLASQTRASVACFDLRHTVDRIVEETLTHAP